MAAIEGISSASDDWQQDGNQREKFVILTSFADKKMSVALASALMAAVTTATNLTTPPHVVFVLVDDWGSFDAGFREREVRPGALPQLRTPTEAAVGKVWAEVLELPAAMVDPEESFFDQGGHSLRATRLMNK